MHHSPLFITAKVRGVIILDEKIFLARHAKAGFYCLPGGTLEPGETRLEGLHREIIEELGVEPEIGDLIYTQELQRSEWITTIDFWYEIKNPKDFTDIDLASCSHGFESSEVGFYDLADIIGNYRPLHLERLLADWNKNGVKFVQK